MKTGSLPASNPQLPHGAARSIESAKVSLESDSLSPESSPTRPAQGFPKHPLANNRKRYRDAAVQTGVCFEISYDTLRQTSQLCGDGDWDNMSIVRSQQNEILAQRILNKSAVVVPLELGESRVFKGYVGNPMDMRPYIDRISQERRISKLEDNTSGWGGLLEAPEAQLNEIAKTLRKQGGDLAKRIKDPVVLVGCSGRAKINPRTKLPAGNSIMGEKIWVAEQLVLGMKGKGKTPDVIGFEPDQFKTKLKETNYQTNGKSTIIIGYSHQLNNAKLDEEDELSLISVVNGQVRFAGRDVHYIVNERFASYIEAKHGKIDPNKTLIGPMIDLGTNKALAYEAHNKFVAKPGVTAIAPSVAHKINFTSCNSEDEILDAMEDFHEGDMGSVGKPKGTGNGDGLVVRRPARKFNKATWASKIEQSIANVDRDYNKHEKVAGMPYTVCEYLEGATIQVPDDLKEKYGHLEGMQFEIRVGVCKRKNMQGELEIVAVPNTVRLQLPGSDVSNITAQKALLGLRSDELMLPATNADVMRLIRVDEKEMTEIAEFCAAYKLDALTDLHNEE